VCDDRPVRRSATVAEALAIAALHIHLHHRFHGPPFDYVGLGVAAAASWIGVPGPGEPVLIAAGILAAKGKLNIGSVMVVAWVGATIGGILGWMVGHRAGRVVLTAPGPLRSARIRAADRGERLFARHPVIAVLLTPSWIAGINRVRSSVYQPTNALSAVAWAVGFGLGGYFAGAAVIEVAEDLGVVTTTVVICLVAALVAVELVRRRRRAS
jgi:membrane-associated protein